MPIEVQTFATTVKPDAHVPLVIVEVGQRGLLDAEHAVTAARGILAARETYPAAQIVLSVGGYEADKRELWDVPEVVDYLLAVFDAVFTEWPNGSLNDLRLDDSSAALILCCTGALRVVGRDPKTGDFLFAPG
jgi:hypothetical protein